MLHAAFFDTLPGWPYAANPSVAAVLILLFGLPLAVGAIITVLGMGSRWRRGTNSDAYAADVRRAMAFAGSPSPWSDESAGAERNEAPALTGDLDETERGQHGKAATPVGAAAAGDAAGEGATAARRAID